eukprot:GHVL01016630.1.p1 GENE.GHVL01016630.1~~GHVL01016630.1.p1  ORF type:complete len:169 (-),score=6.04 GHVL01016630.1:253-759(-)
MEPLLPGWQYLHKTVEEDARRAMLNEKRHKTFLMYRLINEGYEAKKVSNPKVGSWVVFPLSGYEKSKQDETSLKYAVGWSLPHKVVIMKDKALHCQMWGDPSRIRQVPLNSVRKLEGQMSSSIANLNEELLERWKPNSVKQNHSSSSKQCNKGQRTTWNELLTKSVEN